MWRKDTVGYYGAIVNLSIHGIFSFIAAVEQQQRELAAQDVVMNTQLKTLFHSFFHDKPLCAAVQSSSGLLDGFERARPTVFRLVDDLIDDLYRQETFIPRDFIDTLYPALRTRVATQFGIELPMMPFMTSTKHDLELVAA